MGCREVRGTTPSVDVGDEYERVRRRFIGTVLMAGDTQAATPVPATPDWTVRDVLTHVIGLCSDLNALHFPDVGDQGGNGWTALQVEARRGRALDDLFAEWDREAPTFVAGLREFGYEFGCHFVADLHAHHQDVRVALGLPADDDPATVAMCLHHYLAFTDEVLSAAGWGTLEVVVDGNRRLLGGNQQPRATVAATSFDLLRALSGRRTRDQILEFEWSGDAEGALDAIEGGFAGNYAFPISPVEV